MGVDFFLNFYSILLLYYARSKWTFSTVILWQISTRLARRSRGHPEDVGRGVLGEEDDVERVWVDDHALAVVVPVRVFHLDRPDVVRVDLDVFQQHHRLGKLVDSQIGPSRGEKNYLFQI